MAECEILHLCPFFNDQMGGMPATSKFYKSQYCKSDNSNCSRFIVFKALGIKRVPPDLFPNQADPPLAFSNEPEENRFVFDRRNETDRRNGDDTDFLLKGGLDQRSWAERRELSERRKYWDRVTKWCSVSKNDDGL